MTRRIHREYPEAKIEGVLIQPMVTGGRELIVGGRQDRQFGPVVLVGLGGIFVEIFGEVSVRVAPISRREASEMIDELRGAAIFKGARGLKPSDIEIGGRGAFAPLPASLRSPGNSGNGHQSPTCLPTERRLPGFGRAHDSEKMVRNLRSFFRFQTIQHSAI